MLNSNWDAAVQTKTLSVIHTISLKRNLAQQILSLQLHRGKYRPWLYNRSISSKIST